MNETIAELAQDIENRMTFDADGELRIAGHIVELDVSGGILANWDNEYYLRVHELCERIAELGTVWQGTNQ